MVDTSLAPYYDDYDEDKGFARLLYRPGRAVQARELTQLQTILQNQITRFGQNIFLDGSVVVPGGVSVDTNYEYLTITDAELGGVISGATLVGNTSNMIAEVIQAIPAENGDPVTLYLRYTGGGGSDGGRFQTGETVTWTNPETGSGSYTSSGTGVGTKVDLDKGIYFVNGFFVAAVSQSLLIEKYGIPSGVQEIGLIFDQELVTSNDDPSLLDNANGTNNKNAPGADRLKNTLSLIKKDAAVDGDGLLVKEYFTIVTIKDQEIVEQLTRSQYALLGQELARRTFDESGNYTVEPFIVRAQEHPTDETLLDLVVDTGKAYVRGYEIDKPLATRVETRRALDTDLQNNGRTSTYFGNYIRVNTLSGVPNLSTFPQYNLKDGGVTIGTARIRYIEAEAADRFRLYLFEVEMTSGAFNQVETIDGTNFSATLINASNAPTSNDAILEDTRQNSLLFRVPNSRIKSIQDITVRVQRYISMASNGSGEITLDTNAPTQTWASYNSWIITQNDGTVVTPSSTGTGAQTITLSGLNASETYRIAAILDKTTATSTARAKTLNEVSDIKSEVGGVVELGEFDIYKVDEVLDGGGNDITDNYRLDNGQRDNYYDEGKLILKSGRSPVPGGSVTVNFSYFSHGTGDYFSVDSYNSLVDLPEYTYKDIPVHRFADGRFESLSEYFDFRPRKNSSGSFSGSGAFVNELPQQNESIQGDVTYFLPRVDVLYLDEEGTFGISEGNPSLDATIPPHPDNAMAIYQIFMNAGTLDEQDIFLSFVENKRYTMRDIGKIENRVDRLEEFATLSALETSTAAFEVLDDNGNNRFKSGFFVDNFNDHAFADFTSPEYRSSIDPVAGEVRPTFDEKNIRLVYKAATNDGTSSNMAQVGDMLMLDYTEELEIQQELASSSINVNPYSVITGIGGITISPETDEWRDVETQTVTTTIQGTTRVNPIQFGNWGNWAWNWAGRPTTPVLDGSFQLGGGATGGAFGGNFREDIRNIQIF